MTFAAVKCALERLSRKKLYLRERLEDRWINFRYGQMAYYARCYVHYPLWYAWHWRKYHKCWTCAYQNDIKVRGQCGTCRHNPCLKIFSNWMPKPVDGVESLKYP